MSRKTSAARARKAQVREIAWKPAHAELFAMAGEDWVKPRTLELTTHTTGWTFSARFGMPNGNTVVLTTRIRRYADGSVCITRQQLDLRFYVAGQPAIPGGVAA